jgi:hypothetical protein
VEKKLQNFLDLIDAQTFDRFSTNKFSSSLDIQQTSYDRLTIKLKMKFVTLTAKITWNNDTYFKAMCIKQFL